MAGTNHVADHPGSGGFLMMRSKHMSLISYSHSSPSGGQLLPNDHPPGAGGFRSLVPVQPPQQIMYASLPSSFTTPPRPLPLVQPPLLPLPSAKAAAAAGPPKMNRATGTNGGTMKAKPAPTTVPRKATNYSRPRDQKERPRRTVENNRNGEDGKKVEEGEDGEEVMMESIYSLSPSPCNLPLPNFLLRS